MPGPIRFPFWEPNRRPKTGFEVVAAQRQVSGFTANPSPSSGAEKSGEKIASFDMNRRRMSASIISDVTSITYRASRGWRLFCAKTTRPPPFRKGWPVAVRVRLWGGFRHGQPMGERSDHPLEVGEATARADRRSMAIPLANLLINRDRIKLNEQEERK